jgi:hypothetical protein
VRIPSRPPGDTGAATGTALHDRVSVARSASDRGRTGSVADIVMPVVAGEVHGASAGHMGSRTQIIPICVIGAGSDEIGEAVQLDGCRLAAWRRRR